MAQPQWIPDLSAFLKLLEKDSPRIHEFRRSFEAGKKQKQVHPQIEQIYLKCKDSLKDPALTKIFDSCQFKLTLGLKTISLKSVDVPEFKDLLLQLFSNWDPQLPRAPLPVRNPISMKKLQQVMNAMNSMSDEQLSKIFRNVPKDQLEVTSDLFQTPESQEMARKIAEKIKNLD